MKINNGKAVLSRSGEFRVNDEGEKVYVVLPAEVEEIEQESLMLGAMHHYACVLSWLRMDDPSRGDEIVTPDELLNVYMEMTQESQKMFMLFVAEATGGILMPLGVNELNGEAIVFVPADRMSEFV